jgi:YggT family protein
VAQFIAHIILSWLINFQVLNLRQPIVALDLGRAEPAAGPFYSRIRRFCPIWAGSTLHRWCC